MFTIEFPIKIHGTKYFNYILFCYNLSFYYELSLFILRLDSVISFYFTYVRILNIRYK